MESPPNPKQRTLARHQPQARAAHAACTQRHTHRGRTKHGDQRLHHKREMHIVRAGYKGGVVAPFGSCACRRRSGGWRRKRIDMSPGVPYVSVRSNDVLNGSLDLVLRLCTRVDTVWRVLRPGREVARLGLFYAGTPYLSSAHPIPQPYPPNPPPSIPLLL